MFNPEAWQRYLELQKEIAKNPSYKAHMEMAKLYNYPFKDFETEYFNEINEALKIKYPQKNLDYYEEAVKYYSKNWSNWSFIPDGKDYNFYYDLDEVINIRDELNNNEDKNASTTELINKIDFGLFRKAASNYDYYRYKLKKEEYIKKTEFSSYYG